MQSTVTSGNLETAYLSLQIKLCSMHKLYNGLIMYSVYSGRQNKTNLSYLIFIQVELKFNQFVHGQFPLVPQILVFNMFDSF